MQRIGFDHVDRRSAPHPPDRRAQQESAERQEQQSQRRDMARGTEMDMFGQREEQDLRAVRERGNRDREQPGDDPDAGRDGQEHRLAGADAAAQLVRGAEQGERIDAHPQLRLFYRGDGFVGRLVQLQAVAHQQRAIVPLQPMIRTEGTRTPIFAVPGHNGDVFCYRALARALGEDQPFYGLQPPGLDGESEPLTRIEDLAAYFAAQIRAFLPQGRCVVIAGFCAGGTVAFELAMPLRLSAV